MESLFQFILVTTKPDFKVKIRDLMEGKNTYNENKIKIVFMYTKDEVFYPSYNKTQ